MVRRDRSDDLKEKAYQCLHVSWERWYRKYSRDLRTRVLSTVSRCTNRSKNPALKCPHLRYTEILLSRKEWAKITLDKRYGRIVWNIVFSQQGNLMYRQSLKSRKFASSHSVYNEDYLCLYRLFVIREVEFYVFAGCVVIYFPPNIDTSLMRRRRTDSNGITTSRFIIDYVASLTTNDTTCKEEKKRDVYNISPWHLTPSTNDSVARNPLNSLLPYEKKRVKEFIVAWPDVTLV